MTAPTATFTVTSWSPGDVTTEEKMDDLAQNDVYNAQLLLGHVHDGSDSAEVVAATDDGIGSVYYFETLTGTVSSGGGTTDVWLTDDGTSGGANIFESAHMPAVWVQRADTGGNDASNRNVGHDNAGANHYTFEVIWTSSRWRVRITNNDASNGFPFYVVAVGT